MLRARVKLAELVVGLGVTIRRTGDDVRWIGRYVEKIGWAMLPPVDAGSNGHPMYDGNEALDERIAR